MRIIQSIAVLALLASVDAIRIVEEPKADAAPVAEKAPATKSE